MLAIADLLLTLVHLAIIGFNLTAWIWPRTRRAHLVVAAITLFCWFVLGIWYGMGYCPVTDWQWRIKELRGEHDLPPSFVTWAVIKLTSQRPPDSLVDTATASSFAVAILLSLYVNFFRSGRGSKKRRQS